jgi:hypothetical protein
VGAGVRLSSVQTDDRGAFSFEAAPGRTLILARADGYASEQREIFVRPGPANPTLNFSLPRVGSLSGRVVDAAGAGVPDARVWVQYRGERHTWRLADEVAAEPTDAFGNFTIPSVAQGRPFALQTESRSWLPSFSQTMMLRASELRGVVLVLDRRGGSVAGYVRDSSGRPVSGAQVQLRIVPAQDAFTTEQRESIALSRAMIRSAVSGEDGSYSFEGVPEGRVVITALNQNQRAAGEIETTPGRPATVDLALR